MNVRVLASALLGLLFTACTTVNHGRFTVLSNKHAPLDGLDLASAERIHDVVGRDVNRTVVVFPTKLAPSLDSALDDALAKTGGDVMVDVEVEFSSWTVPLVYGESVWEVRGDVLRTRKSPAATATPTPSLARAR